LPLTPVPDSFAGVTQPSVPASAAARCLLVDDDPQVRSVLVRLIEGQGLECLQASNGAEALKLLAEQGEVPLCITDIYMPQLDGVGFLREARRRYPDMAVIMLTGVSEVATAVECLQIGAMDYISKPVMLDEVRMRIANALEKRNLVLQNRFYQQSLESRVRELDHRNKQSLLNGVEMLVFALEAKDSYTSGHSMRVKEFATRTAIQLGFTGELLAQIELGSKLHDIGKIGIRETVLNKPGVLSPDEFEHIKLHAVLGERILQPFLAEQPPVLRIVRSHHERWDGTGFPDGTAREVIPIEARIVAVADAYDAMTTNRAYRPPRNPAGAVEELRLGAGTHFDPDVVAAFLRAYPDLATHPLHA
jgi:response regulator RpfG family c-di-GMP phosphodiesterase